MTHPVVVVGMGADGLTGLSPRALEAVRNATLLAGGRRHLLLVGDHPAETFAITDNIDSLVSRLARRSESERCVVLASGDPLYFGIGHRISEGLGREQVVIETTTSSMQLAFARVGISWHDATIASIHGRPFEATLIPLLGSEKIGLFTTDGDSPSNVVRFFLDRGLSDYDCWVCENLGAAGEAVTQAAPSELLGRRFSALNILIMRRRIPPQAGSDRKLQELADESFARPDSGAVLLTHEDVRALVLRRFRGLGPGPIWDVGAGLGGVSVELARAFPATEVVAFERSAVQLSSLRANRERFEAFNLRVVEGEAPSCLIGEEWPAGVFLGGSGGKLEPILNLITERLRPGGRLVANFVGLENLVSVLARLKSLAWDVDLTEVRISRGSPLSGLTTFVPQRPVWVIRSDRPPT